MIKLICPKCMKPVPLADDFSGTEVSCPHCQKTFEAPARYNPAVLAEQPAASPPAVPPVAATQPEPASPPLPTPAPEPRMSADIPSERPVPPPGFVPPQPAMAPAPHAPPAPPGLVLASSYAHTPAPTPQLAGYTHAIGITISPKVIVWLPAVLLTIVFFCTFFRWTGSYLGGHPVYSQSPWQAVFASVSRNFALEANMPGSGVWLDQVTSDWLLLVPFLLAILAATVLAWTDRVVHDLAPGLIPPLTGLWPWRKVVIGVLATLAFVLVCSQLLNGFGMERAIRKTVRDEPALAKAREEAANSPAKLAAVENREDSELAKYNLARTAWQDLALLCNFFAVVAVFLSIPLEKRGNKPPPKILLHY